MSAPWQRFESAYDAVGRARAEGYPPSAFEGLTPDERARALAMLLARAEAGEAPEVLALAHFDEPAARDAVARAFAAERAPTLLRLAAARAGWALTGDPNYQAAVAHLADRGEGVVRRVALGVVCAMTLTPEALAHVTARLLTEPDRLTAVQLAKAVLRSRGVAVDAPEDFQRALPAVRELTAPDLAARAAAVARLGAPRTA